MSEKRMVYAEDVIQRIRDLAPEILGGWYNPDMENELEQLVCIVESTPTAADTDVQRWRKTAEEPPTRKDGNKIGSILCAGYHCNIRDGMWLENIMPWHVVRDNPGMFPLWMPLPKMPDLSVPERRCMMGND